ncbi:MAG: tripartite tricarboxylate transporter substrate binding protein [Comamonas sp.]
MSLSPLNRRTVLQGAAAWAGASVLGTAQAQAGKAPWPSKPIRIIVPYNAGGSTDAVARTLAEAMGKRLGKPVMVENRGGASGILGTDAVARAPADGHTLLVSLSTSMMVNQFLYSKLPYNPEKDLELITQIATAPIVLVVHPSVPANTMQEMLEYVKAHKGQLSYGSWGQGSQAHLVGAYLSKMTGADMTHVAYKGEAPMLQDLLGGQLQMCFAGVAGAKPFVDAGRLKAIGLVGRERAPTLPKVATLHEQGLSDAAYSVVGWIGMGAPAGLPPEVLAQLSSLVKELARDPKVQEQLVNTGGLAVMGTPQAFREAYQRDAPAWKALVAAANVKLD